MFAFGATHFSLSCSSVQALFESADNSSRRPQRRPGHFAVTTSDPWPLRTVNATTSPLIPCRYESVGFVHSMRIAQYYDDGRDALRMSLAQPPPLARAAAAALYRMAADGGEARPDRTDVCTALGSAEASAPGVPAPCNAAASAASAAASVERTVRVCRVVRRLSFTSGPPPTSHSSVRIA